MHLMRFWQNFQSPSSNPQDRRYDWCWLVRICFALQLLNPCQNHALHHSSLPWFLQKNINWLFGRSQIRWIFRLGHRIQKGQGMGREISPFIQYRISTYDLIQRQRKFWAIITWMIWVSNWSLWRKGKNEIPTTNDFMLYVIIKASYFTVKLKISFRIHVLMNSAINWIKYLFIEYSISAVNFYRFYLIC